jgi:hypothetical protein
MISARCIVLEVRLALLLGESLPPRRARRPHRAVTSIAVAKGPFSTRERSITRQRLDVAFAPENGHCRLTLRRQVVPFLSVIAEALAAARLPIKEVIG